MPKTFNLVAVNMAIFDPVKLQSTKVQRFVYLIGLCFWSFITFLFNDFEDLSRRSSFGIPYMYIFCTVEFLLLMQFIRNSFIGWLVTCFTYIFLFLMFLIRMMEEIVQHSDHLTVSYFFLLVFIFALWFIGGYILYHLRPMRTRSSY